MSTKKDNFILSDKKLMKLAISLAENQKYFTYSTFDQSNPNKSIPFTSKEELHKLLKPIEKLPAKKVIRQESSEACVIQNEGKINISLIGKIKKMMPAKTFEIKYKNPLISNQRNSIDVYKDDLSNIFNSRTFCLYEDIDYIKSKGLAKGGSGRPVPLLSQYLIDKA